MTEQEMRLTVEALQTEMKSLSEGFTEFLKVESSRQQKAEDAAKSKANEEVEKWEKQQTFLNKHGFKIASIVFAAITSGLAWYGSQIRSEIDAQQKEKDTQAAITAQREDFEEFKETSNANDTAQQIELVNQTIMIDEGFKRVDKVLIKAYPRQFEDEEDLPPIDPDFENAAKAARTKKIHLEKFGKLPPKDKLKPEL